MNAEERLLSWETGVASPSFKQLESLARAYRRPVLTFFLPSVPVKESSLADFRTVPGRDASSGTPEFSAFMRRVEWLQEGLRELVEQEGRLPLAFVGAVSPEVPAQDVAWRIRKTLDMPFEVQRRLPGKDALFRLLRGKVQELGVFVLVEGDLGSSHSRISPEEFRGIAICDVLAPLIVVNANDSKSAQLFSLVHELAHVWIGASGVSNYDSLHHETGLSQASTEEYCNAVAAEFLVPEVDLREAVSLVEGQDPLEMAQTLARMFKVSPMVVARRCKDVGVLNGKEYWGVFQALKTIWEGQQKRVRPNEGGPSRNVLDRYRLGERVISTILAAANDGRLSLRDASRMLRVKVDRLGRIA
ncbi:hypothetical protein NNJEOMEG_01255 [Fundidesulfovibrio magnetotacticus]|uniref:HTH cro/C1-type domain-containing protein n=2 Tax=Fundidesulfovibrio magnetotacticus TaxID=2730080 RepID=A0A6V8LL56_9BACT|nr:hypothetical protein NNJEOMEG_01255 [Fundidesulfovibrio magnetotacticus]